MILWYVNHYAKPPSYGTSGRPYFLARELAARGHEVVIVAASRHHAWSTPLPEDRVERLVEIDGVRYFFLETRPYRGNGAGRWLNMTGFGRKVGRLPERVARGEIPRPDLVIASCAHIFAYPPAHRAARRLGAKSIYEVRDLWPMSLVELAGIPSWHPAVLWMAGIERRAYHSADAVVSLLHDALAHMEPRGLSPERFCWIPNGVWAREWETEESVEAPAEHRAAIEDCRRRGRLVVAYAGAHGPPNALDQVLDLARVGGGERPYHFLFVGDGVSRPQLQERASREGIDFVTFLPKIPKAEARAVIRAADACFIGWQDRPIYRYGISANKIFEYMMAGKPVVHAIGECDDPVRTAGAGVSVPPYAPADLDAALRRLAQTSPAEREEMGRRGRRHVLENYEWSVLGGRYAELCEKLVAGAR